MIFPEIPENLINTLKNCRRVIICGHVKPDGDCSNSAIAVSFLATALGKKAIIVNDGPFSNSQISGYENYITEAVPPEFSADGTLGIVVDCSTPDRLGSKAVFFENIKTAVIDHHQSGVPFGNYRYIVPDSPSTTLLVFKLFKAMGVVPDKKTSEHLFRGFATDSGFFRFIHSQSGPVFSAVSELADLGADPNKEYNRLFEQQDFNTIKYLSVLISRTKRFFSNRLCISWEEKKDLETFGNTGGVSDMLYQQMLSVKETEAVFFFKYSQNQSDSIEVGMRASGYSDIDVGSFAGKFGGGGHKKASGVTIRGTMEHVRKLILQAASEELFYSADISNLKAFVDTHFHSSMLDISSDSLEEQLDKMILHGFAGGIDIGTDFNDLPSRASKLKKYPQILLSAAMGPWACGKSETSDKTEEGFEITEIKSQKQIDDEFAVLCRNIEKYNPLFIGECGLDYYWEYGTHQKQIKLFNMHMDMAYKLNKRVIIHSRDAVHDTCEIINKYKGKVSGVIHCFGGGKELLKTALDCGYYISFAGNITYKKNEELRNALALVPDDRLLLETDSPYLAPEPFRGNSNSPALIPHIYMFASHIRGVTASALAETVINNFRVLSRQS